LANGETRVEVGVDVLLRNVRRIDELERKLRALANIKIGGVKGGDFDKAALAAQRLAVQSKELENRQERARLTSERLALQSARLANVQTQSAAATNRAADAHVKYFKATLSGGQELGKAADAHVRYFKAVERVSEAQKGQADAHVRFFRSVEASRPALDAHVQAYKAIEKSQRDAAKSTTTLEQQLASIGGSLRNLGLGLTSLGSALSIGLTAPLAAIGIVSTQSAVSMDSLKRGLAAVAGSASEAETQLARLTDIAKLPGIGFAEAIQGSVRLQALGISAEVAERSLKAFSNAVALTGGSPENLDRLLIQLTQLLSKGKILQQDLRFIIENAPATGKALRDAFGTVDPQAIEALGITTDEFLDKFLTGLENLPKAAAGARNAFDNFKDSIFRASAAVGEGILPALTNLINAVEPVVTTLAKLFSSLPQPVQTVIVGVGALLAALGPVLFVVGQLSTGVGGLISSFGRLSTLGIAPTVAGFKTLITVMLGAETAAIRGGKAAKVAAAGWAALGGSLLGIVGIAAVALVALGALSSGEKELVDVDVKAAAERAKRLPLLRGEISSLVELARQVTHTSEEEERLRKAYESLEGPARGRHVLLDTEAEKLKNLIEARRAAARADVFAQRATAVAAVQNVINALDEEAAAQKRLTEAQKEYNNAAIIAQIETGGQIEGAALLAKTQEVQARASLKAAEAEKERVAAAQKGRTAVGVMKELGEATNTTTDAILTQAQAGGKNAEEIERARLAAARFAAEQEKVEEKVKDAGQAIRDLTEDLKRMGDESRKAFNANRDVIDGLISSIVAGASTIENTDAAVAHAIKTVNEYIRTVPGVGEALERTLRGRKIEEVLRERLGLSKGAGQKELRAAGEQLANAIAEEAEAGQRRTLDAQKDANDRLLALNEFLRREDLRGHAEHLRERARLTALNLQLEIKEQQAVAERAEAARRAALDRAAKAGATPGEVEKEQADAQRAVTRRLDAQAAIVRLTREQREVNAQLIRDEESLLRAGRERTSELAREIFDLQGDAKRAADLGVDERFRKELENLNRDLLLFTQLQANYAEDGNKAGEARAAAAAQEVKQTVAAIDATKNLLFQQNAVTDAVRLAGEAQELFTNQQEAIRQEVELGGITVEESVSRRLALEEDLKASLITQRGVISNIVGQMAEAPQALVNTVDALTVRISALGKLTFTEQFDLAEREFTRTQDELRSKIQDVERAVRSRDIAEAEGRLLIRRLNGEYAADLERQVELLKKVAAQSNDAGLQRQAESAGQAAKDTRAAADELKNFDRQLRAVSIDSFSDSLSQLFKDLRDDTEGALQDILNFFNRILDRVNDFIAENLAREITESLFPDPNKEGDKEGGFVGFFKRVLGLGGGADQTTDKNTTATEQNTEALNGLTATFGGEAGGLPAGRSLGGFVQQAVGGLGSLFGGEEEGGGGVLGVLGGLFGGAGAAGAAQGSTVIDSLNINSDELARNTEALKRNTEAQGGASGASSQGFISALGSLFSGGGEFGGAGEGGGFASGGRVPIRVSKREVYVPPKHVKDMGLDYWKAVNSRRLVLGDSPALIDGPGTTRSDSIPALAPPGSFILNAQAADESLLSSVNLGRGRFALGGEVDGLPSSSFAASGGARGSSDLIVLFDRKELANHVFGPNGRRHVVDLMGEEAGTIRRKLRID
jgi:tape measure domain-containing protein